MNLRFVNGLFIAACTRTAGFSSLSITALHPAVQTSYMIMMYISVFPIAISIRRTNVYEEKSLGMYDKNDVDDESVEDNTMKYVGSHLRRQLSFDLWYVFSGLFLLTITEAGKLEAKEFNMFDVLFELISAYGTVGLSMGYPGINTSLCGTFSTGGKLIIIAMQIRGRHRGLPYGLDRAIMLPSEARFKEEAEAALPALGRSQTQGSIISRGRSMERTHSHNPNIFTSFLQPGPAIVPEAHPARLMDEPRRVNSMPVETDDEDLGNPAGSRSERLRPARARTYAGNPASSRE